MCGLDTGRMSCTPMAMESETVEGFVEINLFGLDLQLFHRDLVILRRTVCVVGLTWDMSACRL